MQFDIIDQTNYSSVESIYQQGMATGFMTFQDEVPSWESWDKDYLRHSRLLSKKVIKSWVGGPCRRSPVGAVWRRCRNHLLIAVR